MTGNQVLESFIKALKEYAPGRLDAIRKGLEFLTTRMAIFGAMMAGQKKTKKSHRPRANTGSTHAVMRYASDELLAP